MEDAAHNQMVSLIWNIADDVLRDVFLRGQYRDVILPMIVLVIAVMVFRRKYILTDEKLELSSNAIKCIELAEADTMHYYSMKDLDSNAYVFAYNVSYELDGEKVELLAIAKPNIAASNAPKVGSPLIEIRSRGFLQKFPSSFVTKNSAEPPQYRLRVIAVNRHPGASDRWGNISIYELNHSTTIP